MTTRTRQVGILVPRSSREIELEEMPKCLAMAFSPIPRIRRSRLIRSPRARLNSARSSMTGRVS